MAVMVYALYTYHWRASSIRKGGRGPYDDRVGPVSTVSKVLYACQDANFVLDNPVCRATW